MIPFVSRALMGIASGTFKVGKATLGGPIRRSIVGPLAGTAIGGIHGLATSESESPTQKAQDMMRGAFVGGLAGAGIGLMTTKLPYIAARKVAGALTGIGKGRNPLRSPIARMATGTARAGYGAARFTMNNPRTAFNIAAGGLGLYTLGSSGPSTTYSSSAEMGLTGAVAGVSSTGFDPGMSADSQQNARNFFINSTDGLTLGLNNRRHR